MTTMIERVARAMCLEGSADETVFLGVYMKRWEAKKDEARAAIEAMREPTESMVSAAENGDDPGSSIYGDPFVAMPHDEAWKTMIDAALKEKP